MPDPNLFADLTRRGLVADVTPGLEEVLFNSKESNPKGKSSNDGTITLYLGIDPTSDSLHLGSFLGVLMLERFRLAGHRPIALVGGATGMIGDPSGRSKERNLLDEKTLQYNFEAIQTQIQNLTKIPSSDFVDNRQWSSQMSILEFLRDVGKHATINQMIAKEAVKSRMEGADGISYTEFSYMLLQANDFHWLSENMGCDLQVGGSDQWGNITAGVDLIRRKSGNQAYGLVWHLVEKSDGQKFGKTADGTIWLDAEKTSPYDFHQYLSNLDDKAACQLLYWLTLSPCDELDAVVKSHNENPQSRQAQQYLADWVTSFVHGAEVAAEAKSSGKVMFGSNLPTVDEIESLRGASRGVVSSDRQIEPKMSAIPETSASSSELETPEALVELLVKTELCSSKGDARRQLKQGAISVNGKNTKEPNFGSVEPLGGKYFLIGRGKKKRHLVVLEK